MKVIWRIVSIAAAVLLLAGIAMIAVSLFTGGSLEGIRNNVMLADIQKEFKDEQPTVLLISCNAGKLTVIPGDQLRVEAHNVPEVGFICTMDNGVLTIGEKRTASWSDNLSRMLSLRKMPPEICVYLPENTALARTVIEMSTGEAWVTLPGTANDYTAKIETGAGNIHYYGRSYSMTETSVGEGMAALKLHSAAGNIEVGFQN